MRLVRIALDRRLDRASAFGRRIAMVALQRGTIELHKLRKIDSAAEGGINGVDIGLKPVRGDLDAIGKP